MIDSRRSLGVARHQHCGCGATADRGGLSREWKGSRSIVSIWSEAALADVEVGSCTRGMGRRDGPDVAPMSVIGLDIREADRQAFSGAFDDNPRYLLRSTLTRSRKITLRSFDSDPGDFDANACLQPLLPAVRDPIGIQDQSNR